MKSDEELLELNDQLLKANEQAEGQSKARALKTLRGFSSKDLERMAELAESEAAGQPGPAEPPPEPER